MFKRILALFVILQLFSGLSFAGPVYPPVSVTSASNDIVISPSPGKGTFTVKSTAIINPIGSATTYTILSTDMGKTVTHASGSSVAVTLPQAGTTGFATGVSYSEINTGAGSVTITPTTSTINGAATLVLAQNQAAWIISDGTNYIAFLGSSGGGGSVSVTAASANIAINPTPGTGTFTIGVTELINAQGTAASYTILSSDMGKTVTHNKGTSVAVTLPQATTTGFGSGAAYTEFNLGAGVVTITPTTSTINGAATFTLSQNQGVFVISDGTNYIGLPLSNSGAGTVTSITMGTGLSSTQSPLTTAGTMSLSALSANQVLGALTAVAPSGLSIPSCSSASSALTWTSGTGFGCNTISGSGTVNSGTSGQLTYYASSSTAVSGNANATISTGALTLGQAGVAGSVVLNGATSGTVTVKVPAAAGTGTNFQLPATNGSNTNVLQTDGSGNTSWVAAGGGVSVTSASNNILITPSPGTGTFTVGATQVINAQGTAASYTILSSDMGKTVTHSKTTAVAVTLPQATTTGFTAGAAYTETNLGVGPVTITPTTSTINGYASIVLQQNESVYITSDGTNYIAFMGRGLPGNSTKFTASGCSNSSTVGGATAGKFTSGTTGTCAVTITMNGAIGATAPNGWSCWASDRTTPANIYDQNSDSTTTASFTGTTVSGDVISFGCVPY